MALSMSFLLFLETFTHEFVVPSSLKSPWSFPKRCSFTSRVGLGVEIVVQGIAGSDIKTIITQYAGEIQPNNWAKTVRDVFQQHAPLPLKVFAHPGHDGSHYLSFAAGTPFQFHLVSLVCDLTIPFSDKIKEELISEINLLNKYIADSYGTSLPHAVLVVGTNLEVKHDGNKQKSYYLIWRKNMGQFIQKWAENQGCSCRGDLIRQCGLQWGTN